MKSSNPKENDLRVWHIPQIPMDAFHVPVTTPEEAIKIMHILADYDMFQYENKVKPDFSSASGLEIFEGGEWCEWYSERGEDIDDYAECLEENKRNLR